MVQTIKPDQVTFELARRIVVLNRMAWAHPLGLDVDAAARELLDKIDANPSYRFHCVFDGDELVCKARTAGRIVATEAGQLTLMELAGVCAHPDVRGKGYGRAVAEVAFARVNRGEYPVSLFQTSYAVQPFYEKLGCRRINTRVVNSLADDPEADAFWNELLMIYPATYDLPDGVIDLLGSGY